jgi:hypothetical protein
MTMQIPANGVVEALRELLRDLDERADDGERFNPGTCRAMESARAALAGQEEGFAFPWNGLGKPQ